MELNASHMIIGMGEIGQGLYSVIGPCLTYDKKLDQDTLDSVLNSTQKIPVLHICIPFSKDFVKEVQKYKARHKADLVIIYSTVPVGTTRGFGKGFVHSPIEGRHPYLARSIKMAPRWLGSGDKDALKRAGTMWASIVEEVRMLDNSDWTEFLKLRSTSRYGVNIAFAKYEADVAEDLGMDWNHLMEFDRDYNKLYRALNLPDLQRYVLTKPDGPIGGHCVVPNAEMLDKQWPDKLLKEIK